jgi:hypothetical protein
MSLLPALQLTQILADLKSGLQTVIANVTSSITLPPTIMGGLREPDGTAASQLLIEVMLPVPGASPASSSSAIGSSSSSGTGPGLGGSVIAAAGVTDVNGNFELSIPSGISLPSNQSLQLRIRGGPSAPASTSSSSSSTAGLPGSTLISVPANLLGPVGYVGTYTLSLAIPPIPTPIYLALLGSGAAGGPATRSSMPAPPVKALLRFGDDAECIRVLENQSSSERFPYGIFFRLLAPSLFTEREEAGGVPPQRIDTPTPRTDLAGPISVDEFRERLLTAPKLVGTPGLGYILRCAQTWNFEGLALGDLVYSLPLAPGEQQQVVIIEQQTTLQIQDTETIYTGTQTQSAASSDSSTQATFQSALRQSAQGASSYNTASETTANATTGASLGGPLLGGLVGGVVGGLLGILGGPSANPSVSNTSTGTTTTSGSSTSSMDGLQSYASTAAQSVQTNAEQQAMATRRGQRVAMRTATAAETTSVTTKTITNHNKLHALTMQFFEVLRLFDIRTAFEDVTLLALIPLDTVWFLPLGQPEQLPDIANDADISNAIQLATGLGNAAQGQVISLQVAIQAASIGLFGINQQLLINGVNSLAAANFDGQAKNLVDALSPINVPQSSTLTAFANDIQNTQVPAIDTAVSQFRSSNTANVLTPAIAALQAIASDASTITQLLNSAQASNVMTRQKVLQRYAGLLAHTDVLEQWLPSRFLSGLTRLERFAADPHATVAVNSLAEDVVQISANASVLPFDHVYVTVVTRWGTRLGPVEMLPMPPVTVPGLYDPSKRFKTAQDLLQYLQGQRNPAGSANATLQASVALSRALSPSDVIGFEITHTTDSFTYQLAAPIDTVTSVLGNFFGSNGSSWPAPIQGIFGNLIGPLLPTPTAPPPLPTYVTYSPNDIANEIGPPYLWNFQASLLAGVQGNTETYVNANPTPIELPPGSYPVPAAEVSPLLKYSDLLLIEGLLQHVLRNMIRYSKAVWMSLSPEERVMLLEPYTFSFLFPPTASSSSSSSSSSSAQATISVPLLDCVANEVVGFYGNCMMMPFSIPPVVAVALQTSTGDLEDALLRFHRQGGALEVRRAALPTHGVLGEAMLGHCASGEKIDLTRFWNWQDSPGDTAPQIGPVSVPTSALSTLAGAQTPNALGQLLAAAGAGTTTPTVPDISSLAAALAQKAPLASVPDLSNAAQLAQLLQATQTTAAAARQDALDQETGLINNVVTQAANVIEAYLGASPKGGSSSSSTKGGTGGGGGKSSSSSSSSS